MIPLVILADSFRQITTTKFSGYYLDQTDAYEWLKKSTGPGPNEKYHPEDKTDVSARYKVLFNKKKIRSVLPMTTLYPMSTDGIVLFATKVEDAPGTYFKYDNLVEGPADRKAKQVIMEITGLGTDQLKWVTVVDPYHNKVDPFSPEIQEAMKSKKIPEGSSGPTS